METYTDWNRTVALADPHLSWTSLGAFVLWLAALTLVLVDVLTGIDTGDIGIVASAAAATLTVRGYMIGLVDQIQIRERNAFEIGRDSVRSIRREG